MGATGALLFVDMLGVKARWVRLGKKGAEAAFAKVRELVLALIRKSPRAAPSRGCLEADAVALVFDSAEKAFGFAGELFLDAFFGSKDDDDERIWLRGAILSLDDNCPLRSDAVLDRGIGNNSIRTYGCSDRLLEAIQVEKSGFKGMRVVVEKALLTKEVRSAFRKTVAGRQLYLFRSLDYTPLPGRIAGDYEDYLWMASDPARWENARLMMSHRLRWCSPEMGEEFTHAAMTQVVFNECAAILSPRDRQRRG